MAGLAINLECTQGGTTHIRVDMEVRRSGSSNDNAAIRIVRRSPAGDLVLPMAPRFILPADRDIRGWTFIDVDVPYDGVFTYVLQIQRLEGGGTFYGMGMTGVHYRK